MAFTIEIRRIIYDKTDGHCHICHRRISLVNYGQRGAHGAWEVEHSRPRSRGGTNHLNNLLPACVSCNREKRNRTTRTARTWNNTARAPLSKQLKQSIRQENTVLGAVIGGICGAAAGPFGLALGAVFGSAFGRDLKVPKV